MALASAAQTLQALSGRMRMGFGKSADWRWNSYGYPAPTIASIRDVADILRSLWAGETVSYSGPAGNFPNSRLAARLDVPPPPLFLSAMEPKTLKIAGTHFDGVTLHPFLGVETVAESVETIRKGVIEAGRESATAKVVAAVVGAPELSDEDVRLAVHARAAGYLSVKGLGETLVEMNGWGKDALVCHRAHSMLAALGGKPADKLLSLSELIQLSEPLPDDCIPFTSAFGTTEQVVARFRDYLSTGPDEILIHGITANVLGPTTKNWIRP